MIRALLGLFSQEKLFTDRDDEASWLEIKEKILVTSPYKDEWLYGKLYDKAEVILEKIYHRHRLYIPALENKIDVKNLSWHFHRDSFNNRYVVSNKVDITNFSNEELCYLCFFLYLGGVVKGIGEVDRNISLCKKWLDYLINDRTYPPAFFLKGFILKYGVELFSKPNLSKSYEYLSRALELGEKSAAVELENFDDHFVLSNIESVHFDTDTWE